MSDHADWPAAKSPYGLSHNQRDHATLIKDLVAMYSSAIYFRSSSDPTAFQSASGFLFRPAEKTLLVTSAHVFSEGYCALKQSHEDVVLHFGGRQIEPVVVDIATTEGIDLVTLDVSGIEFEQDSQSYWDGPAGRLAVYAPAAWPVKAAAAGDAIMIVGWPAKLRQIESDRKVEFVGVPLGGHFIDDVTDSFFTIRCDAGVREKHWISSSMDPSDPIPWDDDIGGMSGAPVFALHRGGVVPIELVGVVQRYGEGFDVLYCARADLIRADGAIGK